MGPDVAATSTREAAEPQSNRRPEATGRITRKELITAEDRKWWAFQKPVRHPIPQVADARWKANPIDAFIKKSLDEKGLTPAPQADRNTLVRRAYLDLHRAFAQSAGSGCLRQRSLAARL